MVDILHRIGVTSSSPDDVYAALTTFDGLAAWWTEDTQGDGDIIRFRFGEAGGFDMKVLETQPNKLVLWEVVDGPGEWIGTQVRFELEQVEGFTIVLFSHVGWREPVEFMNHCSTRWATFLMSLKKLVETGKAEPWPYEVEISNWTVKYRMRSRGTSDAGGLCQKCPSLLMSYRTRCLLSQVRACSSVGLTGFEPATP